MRCVFLFHSFIKQFVVIHNSNCTKDKETIHSSIVKNSGWMSGLKAILGLLTAIKKVLFPKTNFKF